MIVLLSCLLHKTTAKWFTKLSPGNCVWSFNIKQQLVPIAFFQSNSIVNVAISGFHPDPPEKKNTSAVDHLHVFKEPMAMITSINPTQSTHVRSGDDSPLLMLRYKPMTENLCRKSLVSAIFFRIFNNIQWTKRDRFMMLDGNFSNFLRHSWQKKTQKILQSPVVSPCLLPMGATASTPLAFVHSMRLYLEAAESNFPQKTTGCVDFRKLFLSSNQETFDKQMFHDLC